MLACRIHLDSCSSDVCLESRLLWQLSFGSFGHVWAIVTASGITGRSQPYHRIHRSSGLILVVLYEFTNATAQTPHPPTTPTNATAPIPPLESGFQKQDLGPNFMYSGNQKHHSLAIATASGITGRSQPYHRIHRSCGLILVVLLKAEMKLESGNPGQLESGN